MSLYAREFRPWLFRMGPESAHALACAALRLAAWLPGARGLIGKFCAHADPALETTVAGLSFPNPVGLAAGFDKDCRLAGMLPALGFGFLELGTITLRPQAGNPKPRVFRFPESEALVNRLGFNSLGAEAAAARLRSLGRRPVPIGINIGLNKEVAHDDAPEEYAKTFVRLYPYGNYFAVNVSSPNTEGLRRLQDKLRLEKILTRLSGLNGDRKPIFVKLSPDLSPEALAEIVPVVMENAAGVIATNTTTARPAGCERAENLQGGLSGAPLRDLSTRVIRQVYALSGGRLPIIGAGGVFSAEDAYQKIRAGASLVQLYTGLIYEGPGLPGEINRGLARLLKGHGLKNIGEAVGKSHPEIARR